MKKSSSLIIVAVCCALCIGAAGSDSWNAGKQRVYKQYSFDGRWMPGVDPAKIGPENFSKLQNFRPIDGGIKGVLGYTKINTTALSKEQVQSGIQFVSDRTQRSYVLVQASDGTDSVVYEHRGTIPDSGDFETTALHSDASGAGLGRFARTATGVIYSNGVEQKVWNGLESRIGAFFTMDDLGFDDAENAVEKTDEINNTSTDDYISTASQKNWCILTTRPADGFKIYVKTANDTDPAALSGKVRTSAGWSNLANVSDGTLSGTKSLAQTGWVTFDSTVSTAVPYWYNGYYLYAYTLTLSAGTAEIYHVSARFPVQDIVDTWDSVFRQPIQFQWNDNGTDKDFTSHVNINAEGSDVYTAQIGGMAAAGTDYIIAMFEDRMAGIRLGMFEADVNTNASVIDVKYWSGSAWTSLTETDKTATGGATMAKTGVAFWTPPSTEAKKELYGSSGYAYKIEVSVALSATVNIDRVMGIPAQKEVPVFDFASEFKGRTLLCSYSAGRESNRVDFSLTDSPDCWNGIETSDGGLRSVYFGGVEPLTAGIPVYNRYGSNVFEFWVGLKAHETWVMVEDDEAPFKPPYKVSENIGCPAPLTLLAAETGFEMAQNVQRNVVYWLSYAGPVVFDGAVVRPLSGIDIYFDPANPNSLNYSAIEKAAAFFDPTYSTYYLGIPTGTSTTINLWLGYDTVRQKWFQIDTGIAERPQCGFQVSDSNGAKYVYCGVDTGYLVRWNYGTSWDGVPIAQIAETGDFWINDVWDHFTLRRLLVAAKRTDDVELMYVRHYSDTVGSDGYAGVFPDTNGANWVDHGGNNFIDLSGSQMMINLNDSDNRLVRKVEGMNVTSWAHRFSFRTDTTTLPDGSEPVFWAIEGYVIPKREARR